MSDYKLYDPESDPIPNVHNRVEDHIVSVLEAQFEQSSIGLIQFGRFFDSNTPEVYEKIYSKIEEGYDSIFVRVNEDTSLSESIRKNENNVDLSVEIIIASNPEKEKYHIDIDRNVNFLHYLVKFLLYNNPYKVNEQFSYQSRTVVRRDDVIDIVRQIYNLDTIEQYKIK